MTNQKVKEIYEKAGVELPLQADDLVEDEFWRSIVEGSEKHRIDHIFRVTTGRQGEFLVYNETIIAENLNGNRRYLTKHRQGTYERPIFSRVFDSQTGNAEPIARVDRTELVYEIPYTPEAVKEILAKDQFDTEVGMTLDLGNIQYTIKNKESFVNLPVDQLIKEVQEYY